MNPEEKKILYTLKSVIDPELMINIVDLGLVYHVQHDEDKKKISVDMTLSSPGCPLGDMITSDAREQISAVFPGFEVVVNLVWEPKWTPDMLTDDGKMAMGRA